MAASQEGTGRLAEFLGSVVRSFRPSRAIRVAVITHLLRDRPAFLHAVSQICTIEAVIPIPYSTNKLILDEVRHSYRVETPTLEELLNKEMLRDLMGRLVQKANEPLAVVEIGGYLASVGNELKRIYGDRFIGTIEDTESGHRRYEAEAPLGFPVVSVARSPLKLVEDRLIGPSVVFSLERLVRATDRILNTLTIGVVGYGKIGSSVARAVAGRGARVIVYDSLARRRALAVVEGFPSPNREEVLRQSDVVVGATGCESLSASDFAVLKDGVILASSSSKRIEFDVDGLRHSASEMTLGPPDVAYFRMKSGKTVCLLGNGHPINFLDGAVVGPAMALVQAEQLIGLKVLTDNADQRGLLDVPEAMQEWVADAWLKHFVDIETSGALRQGA